MNTTKVQSKNKTKFLDISILFTGIFLVSCGFLKDIIGKKIGGIEYDNVDVAYYEDAGLYDRQKVVIKSEGITYKLLDFDGVEIDGTWQVGTNPAGNEELEKIIIYDDERRVYRRSNCDNFGNDLTCEIFESWDPVFESIKEEVWETERMKYKSKEESVLQKIKK